MSGMDIWKIWLGGLNSLKVLNKYNILCGAHLYHSYE
jgi:hypothetical protein